MDLFYKILLFLQTEMETPKPYGIFHFICIFLTIIFIIILFLLRKKDKEKTLKIVLGIYGITVFILEFLKQVIWTFNYDLALNTITWDYQWYAFPFQLCTTPIYASLICLFLNPCKIRDSLLSYLAFITILGGFLTILIPDSCFTSDILVNVHTMFLHCGSFVLSVYLIMNGIVKINKNNLKNAFLIFLIFVGLALVLNLVIYNLGILNGETFNMFYISPYFISVLPVFSVIQESVPYLLFLLIYILSVFIGGFIVYLIAYLIKQICKSI